MSVACSQIFNHSAFVWACKSYFSKKRKGKKKSVFTFDLAQKLSSSLLSVEWSHSGYVTTCFINSLVAVLWEQRIKLTSPVGLWHRGSCVCVFWPVSVMWPPLFWGVIPHPDFCHLSTCVRRAVSAYSWQVAVWNPFLFSRCRGTPALNSSAEGAIPRVAPSDLND